MIKITRLSPRDQSIEIEFICGSDAISVKAYITDGGNMREITVERGTECIYVDKLFNNVKYTVFLTVYDVNGQVLEQSATSPFICGYVPGITVAYRDPSDASMDPGGRFFGSPSIAKLSDGTLVASHDLFFWDPHHIFNRDITGADIADINISKVYSSHDGGKTWRFLSDIHACAYGKLFEKDGVLYMFARIYSGNDDTAAGLGIFRSDDGGKSWSDPCVITEGSASEQYHKAAAPVIRHAGRIWAAYDSPIDETGYGAGLVSIDEGDDMMNPENWVVSEPLHYDPAWPGTVDGFWPYMMEEGNVVATPDGLKIMLRYNSVNYEKVRIGRKAAVVFSADASRPAAKPVFDRITPFPGSYSKFTINYDDASGKYYSLINRIIDFSRGERDILTLVSSENLYDWRIERDMINLADAQWYEDNGKAAFSYCDWVFDGDNILAVCRTALHGAHSFHDNNRMTFHLFKNFRE